MKLIVAGPTGFVATEIIRQALSNPVITSVVALGRRPAPEPQKLEPGADAAKLKSVILQDFGDEYPEDVKEELAGADACIWTIAVSPSQSRSTPREQTELVCRDYPIQALETLTQLPRAAPGQKPLRFVYISGHLAQRDPNKKPMILGDYCLIRGEAELRVLEDAANKGSDTVQAAVAKPGLITGEGSLGPVLQRGLSSLMGVPTIRVGEVAAALLHLAVHGSEKEGDTLANGDLMRIARNSLTGAKE